MAAEDPQLAARLVLQTLPAALARVPGPLVYDFTVDGVGAWRVAIGEGRAQMTPLDGGGGDDELDFRLWTDARGLAEMAAGESPLKLMLGGRVRIRGRRRRALRLRAMAETEPSFAEVVRMGAPLDPDAIHRALEYLIDPEWTRGQRFTVAYEIVGDGSGSGGTWYVQVRDGERVRVTTDRPGGTRVDATARLSAATYRRLVGEELTPAQAMRQQLTWVEGEIHPVTLLGRWIERAQGRDDSELRREQRQREIQERRRGSWGARADGAGAAAAPGQGDPAHESEGERRAGGQLLSYGELYALWERQNWKAHELDFSEDREQWLAAPTEAQENMAWSLGSFAIGEERVTADLAPFLLAAPSGEVEIFLATQLVDEARHAAFFDRFGAEVMALPGEDLRTRMADLERTMLGAWHDVFDDGLREIADRIKERPDDLELFVEGITTYHMIIEGVLAMTGQRLILQYMEDHGLYPGFQKGFTLVERDEHRHIAFGVRFLQEALAGEPRYADVIMRRIEELVPKAVHVFVPPYADDPSSFVSYGYDSAQIYGYAYRALKRRMTVVGLEIPPPEALMPGPIASPEEARAAGVPA
jgi:ribonucleoside-diphosphate reductase beta chain